ncbi:MAG TPA: zf-HC2 domain-containing protein [Thermoanaerobaculia bacterium]|nr:zf-HC2 domain-containing protein [Thermoanaerobaculia bacterium]
MNRHVTIEQLSAYLDRELGYVEMRQLDAHFEACPACGARLASMRRTLQGLARVERLAPPPVIAQQIRSRVAAESAAPPSPVRRLLRLVSALPLQPALRTSLAMGLTLVVSLFLVTHGVERESRNLMPPVSPEPQAVVETYLGDPPLGLPPTTSEIAGLGKFVWTDEGWVQRGLEGERPEAMVDVGSPEGKALLTRYTDLELLVADGSTVLMRNNLKTVVELRAAGRPDRILGFEVDPLLDVRSLQSVNA